MSTYAYRPISPERLIIAALRLDPYQTIDELYASVGSSSRKHFKERLTALINAGEVKLTGAYHYVSHPEQYRDYAAILHYLGSGKAGYGELGSATHEIRQALMSHQLDRWGGAFPAGLTQVELGWATHHSMESLSAALDELVSAGEVTKTPGEFGPTYKYTRQLVQG